MDRACTGDPYDLVGQGKQSSSKHHLRESSYNKALAAAAEYDHLFSCGAHFEAEDDEELFFQQARNLSRRGSRVRGTSFTIPASFLAAAAQREQSDLVDSNSAAYFSVGDDSEPWFDFSSFLAEESANGGSDAGAVGNAPRPSGEFNALFEGLIPRVVSSNEAEGDELPLTDARRASMSANQWLALIQKANSKNNNVHPQQQEQQHTISNNPRQEFLDQTTSSRLDPNAANTDLDISLSQREVYHQQQQSQPCHIQALQQHNIPPSQMPMAAFVPTKGYVADPRAMSMLSMMDYNGIHSSSSGGGAHYCGERMSSPLSVSMEDIGVGTAASACSTVSEAERVAYSSPPQSSSCSSSFSSSSGYYGFGSESDDGWRPLNFYSGPEEANLHHHNSTNNMHISHTPASSPVPGSASTYHYSPASHHHPEAPVMEQPYQQHYDERAGCESPFFSSASGEEFPALVRKLQSSLAPPTTLPVPANLIPSASSSLPTPVCASPSSALVVAVPPSAPPSLSCISTPPSCPPSAAEQASEYFFTPGASSLGSGLAFIKPQPKRKRRRRASSKKSASSSNEGEAKETSSSNKNNKNESGEKKENKRARRRR
ncbi:hypothetical protein QOT17_003919 [Balamuthia mandrillaris]